MIVTKRLTLFLTGLLFCLASFAQNRTITGNVSTFDDGSTLVGVSISVKGSGRATLSDSAGNFTIQAGTGQTLQFSYIGYVNKEIVVGKSDHLSVLLNSSQSNKLQDVVVVGYGTQKRENLTGAVTTVNVARTFSSKPINDPTKAL